MPAFGGLTIRARWPLPIGLTRLIIRWLRFFGSLSRLIRLVRVDGRQVVEDRPAARGLGVDAVDGVDTEQAPVLLLLARRAHGARDAIADPQAEPAHLAGADVDVLRARQQAVAAHEAVALVDDVEDAGRVVEAGALRLALEDRSTRSSLRSSVGVSSSSSRPTWRSSATLISRRSATSRSFRSRAASSSCISSYSVTGARPPPPPPPIWATAARPAVAHGSLIWSGHRDRVHLLDKRAFE